ncbi:MAG: MaoC family dehydratase [Hyphomicrobiaceae bacterium]
MLAMVGSTIGVSPWLRIDQDMIDVFADVTHDHQFIHLDDARARAETPFGGTIAHGFLVLSLLSRMFYEAVPPVSGTTMGVNYGFDKIRFLTPVKRDARVRGRFTLIRAVERNPGELTMTYQVMVEIEGAHKPAIAAEWLTRSYVGERT